MRYRVRLTIKIVEQGNFMRSALSTFFNLLKVNLGSRDHSRLYSVLSPQFHKSTTAAQYQIEANHSHAHYLHHGEKYKKIGARFFSQAHSSNCEQNPHLSPNDNGLLRKSYLDADRNIGLVARASLKIDEDGEIKRDFLLNERPDAMEVAPVYAWMRYGIREEARSKMDENDRQKLVQRDIKKYGEVPTPITIVKKLSAEKGLSTTEAVSSLFSTSFTPSKEKQYSDKANKFEDEDQMVFIYHPEGKITKEKITPSIIDGLSERMDRTSKEDSKSHIKPS